MDEKKDWLIAMETKMVKTDDNRVLCIPCSEK